MKRFLKNNSQSPHQRTCSLSSGPKMPPKLFVHIPKTAGTSFRQAAESRFGLSRVLRDYGPNSDATSDTIKREVYSDDDATQIYRAIEQTTRRWWLGIFLCRNTVVSLVSRTRSQFFEDPKTRSSVTSVMPFGTTDTKKIF